jgi:creatinine amidohydrolase
MENFPWTRIEGVEPPDVRKAPVDYAGSLHLGPRTIRERIGDGNFAGRYARSDEDMRALWQVALEETRAVIRDGWAP